MSQIKLNPLTDLGINDSNTDIQPKTQSTSETLSNTPAKSPFEGISEMNSTPQSNSAPVNYTPINNTTPYTVIEQESSPEPKKTESAGTEKNNISSILMVASIILFIISLAALIFFTLMYFKII